LQIYNQKYWRTVKLGKDEFSPLNATKVYPAPHLAANSARVGAFKLGRLVLRAREQACLAFFSLKKL
jgi:hypothetical protein